MTRIQTCKEGSSLRRFVPPSLLVGQTPIMLVAPTPR
jgi:hypothetical protein